MSDKYTIAAVVMPDGIMFAICPSETSIYLSNLVELDNGMMGTVVMTDDYITMESINKREEMIGGKMKRIVKAYSEKKIKWEEEENGEAV